MPITKENKEKIADISVTVVAGSLTLLGLIPALFPFAVAGVLAPSFYDIFKTSGIFKRKISDKKIEKALQNTYHNLIKNDTTGKYETVLNAIKLNIEKHIEDKNIKRNLLEDESLEIINSIINEEDDIQSLQNKKILLDFEEQFFNQLTDRKVNDNVNLIDIKFVQRRLTLVEIELETILNNMQAQINENSNRIANIEKIQNILVRKAPPLVAFNKLFGRENDIKSVTQYLYSDKHMVFLYGMGGVGKTELCASVCSHCLVEPSRVFWFKCTQGLDDGIIVLADTLDKENNKRKDRIRRAKEFLYALDSSYLLVFDNLEYLNKEDVDFLGKLPCKVIVSSRLKHRVLTHMSVSKEVDLIHDVNSCTEIFKHYCQEKEVQSNEISDLKEIILLAGNHTQAIEIIAGIYGVSSTINTINKLYKTVKDSGFDLGTEINTNRDPEKRDFTEHMQHLFNISCIENDDNKNYILKNLCILPSLPIKFTDLTKWLDKYYENTIIELAQLSWIKRKQYIANGVLVDTVEMHQVVCDTLKKSLKPTYNDCSIMINTLRKEIHKKEDDPERYKAEYMPFCVGLAEYFVNSEEALIGNLYYIMAYLYTDIGEYNIAISYYNKSITILKKLLAPNHPFIINAYNNIASNYHNIADFPKALYFYHHIIQIKENSDSLECSYITILYNNIATVYREIGNFKKALHYIEKAIKIHKKHLDENHPNTAMFYSNIADIYHDMGDYQKALDYVLKSINIAKKVFGKDHPNTAASYNSIAIVYQALGNYKKALDYCNLALNIHENTLGKYHPNTARTYSNIASIYHYMDDYQKSLDYYNLALNIDEKVLGFNHPSTATTYSNIASIYSDVRDYKKALDYFKLALDIYEEVLGLDHPDTATTYNNIAGMFKDLEDYKKALDYYTKSYRVMFNVLGENHPNTKTIYDSLKDCYIKSSKEPSNFDDWLKENLDKIKNTTPDHSSPA